MPESAEAREVLRLLGRHHNVLVSGPPGTGKTRLLNEVARLFAPSGPVLPEFRPSAANPLPEGATVRGHGTAAGAAPGNLLPSSERTSREVFGTAFHPGTKYRDFLRGLAPKPGVGPGVFMVSSGTLHRASLKALEPNGAALVVIDEINRGPAVQIFGDAIVAFERDKRLGPDGTPTAQTAPFELMRDDGTLHPFALPYHLYIVAAMNQADTSVEPLDVAFLRRWEPFRLQPDEVVLRKYFGLPDPAPDPPDIVATAADVYSATLRAWTAVNRRIALARGREFQIGHGVLMHGSGAVPMGTPAEALSFARVGWSRVRAHVDEAFFSDMRGVAAVLNVGVAGHPYTLTETFFGDSPVAELVGPDPLNDDQFYALLRLVGQPA